MRIVSAGSFKLEGQSATVEDPHVSDSSIILITFQELIGPRWGTLSGYSGVSNRVPGFEFTFTCHFPGGGSRVGYVIIEP